MSSASFSKRLAAAAAIAFAALGVASSAHARTDVSFSIGIQVPGVYVQPAPVYLHPAPVYMQPRPVYVQPRPVFVQPAPIYYQPRPVVVQQPIYGPYYGPGRAGNHGKWDRKQWNKRHGRDHEQYGNHGRN